MFDFFKKPKPTNPHTREAIEGIAIWAERKKLPKGTLGLVNLTIDESEGFNVTITTTNPKLFMENVQHLANHLRGYMSRKLKVTINNHNIFQTKTDKP